MLELIVSLSVTLPLSVDSCAALFRNTWQETKQKKNGKVKFAPLPRSLLRAS